MYKEIYNSAIRQIDNGSMTKTEAIEWIRSGYHSEQNKKKAILERRNKMVKCPKCGVKGWEYYNCISTLDRDFNDDIMIETNEVECTECYHHYIVKEFFKISFIKVDNVD